MIPRKITLTGKVFIKHIDDISSAALGDVMLQLNDDAIILRPWDDMTVSGYVKTTVFDGLVWQNMDITEFCLNRENKFAKKQRALDSAHLCRSIMEEQIGVVIFKTYRGHYTRDEYEQGEYIRKQNRGRLKNPK
jgi:hypothetical protein